MLKPFSPMRRQVQHMGCKRYLWYRGFELAAAVRGEDIEMPMGTYCAAEAQNPGFFQAVSNNVAFDVLAI